MRYEFPGAKALVVLSVGFVVSCAASPDTAKQPGPTPTPRPTWTAIPGPTDTPGPEPTPTGTPGPAAEPVRFVALGDTGTGTTAQYDVAAGVEALCAARGCDFGVLLGDNFYSSGVASPTDSQWVSKFEEPYGALGFPLYAVLGNHDYAESGDVARGANQIAYAELNPERLILPDHYYSFDRGPAAFLAVNTHLALRDQQPASVEQQKAFFADVLAQTDRPWKIALGHHPYLSNGKHGNAGAYDSASQGDTSQSSGINVKRLYDQTLCGKVDLYLNGHDHNLQALPGPADCPGLFVVAGSSGKVESLYDSGPSHYQSATLGFTYVTMTDTTLTVELVAANGSTLFTREITRVP